MPVFSRRRRRVGVRRGVPGSHRVVRSGAKSNFPVYTYQRPRVAHRKLVHFAPVVVNTVSRQPSAGFAEFPSGTGLYGNVLHVNSIEQGDGLDKRHANKIFMKSLYLSFMVDEQLMQADMHTLFEIIVVYDRETNGLMPSAGDIIDPGFAGPQRIGTRERFDILFRKSYTVGAQWNQTNATTFTKSYMSESIRNIDMTIPINRGTVWRGPGYGVGDILKGSLFVWFHTGGNSTSSSLILATKTRLMFDDIE